MQGINATAQQGETMKVRYCNNYRPGHHSLTSSTAHTCLYLCVCPWVWNPHTNTDKQHSHILVNQFEEDTFIHSLMYNYCGFAEFIILKKTIKGGLRKSYGTFKYICIYISRLLK